MNKFRLPLFLLLIAIPFALFSCKKDKDVEPPTTTDLLVAHEWRGEQVLVGGVDVSARPEIKEMLLDIKSTRLTLRRDGTYTAVYEQAGSMQTTTGTWSFKESETIIYFDLLGDLKIDKLTTTNMNLIANVERDGVVFNAEVRFVKNN